MRTLIVELIFIIVSSLVLFVGGVYSFLFDDSLVFFFLLFIVYPFWAVMIVMFKREFLYVWNNPRF